VQNFSQEQHVELNHRNFES